MRIPREKPGPGQESVWDYPRPPRLEVEHARLRVDLGGVTVADTARAAGAPSYRVLETSHPPTYYLPPAAFAPGALRPAAGSSYCEWKGQASYHDLVSGEVVAARACWSYPAPTAGFEPLRDHVAVMPGAVEACWVDDERVTPQEGGFYGGWITSRVVGPFKGVPGSWGW